MSMQVKVYLVLQRVAFPKEGEPDCAIVAAKLTHALAQALVDHRPGTWIEKVIADKEKVPPC